MPHPLSATMSKPMPMVPVPEALGTVLKETAKSIWFKQLRGNYEHCSFLTSNLIGRISASDVKAPAPGYPNHNSSIMDGYAIKTSDLTGARDEYNSMNEMDRNEFVLDFVVVAKVYAGDEKMMALAETNCRTAIYVTTGAVVPESYDAVIPIEETKLVESSDDDNKMAIVQAKVQSVLNTKPWTWIRKIGCDIPPDSIILSKGELIQPVNLALLSQIGMSLQHVRVKELVRVGVLSTGNELITDANVTSAADGKIPDVNRPLLLAQLSSYGNCEVVDLGIVSDDEGLDAISARLNSALWGNAPINVIITTGGISMGEKDIMEQVFVEGMGGNVHFGRMNMKPGKPTTFITIDRETRGEISRKLVFALPGNPVSASVCTELLVRPCLDMLYHGIVEETIESKWNEPDIDSFAQSAMENAVVHEEVIATLSSDVVLDKGRPEYHRVSLERVLSTYQTGTNPPHIKQQYTYQASSTGVQRSSRVLSLRNADGLMMLPRGGPLGCGYSIAEKGMSYPVLLFSSLSTSHLSKPRFKDSIHYKSLSAVSNSKGQSKIIKLGLIVCISGGDQAHEVSRIGNLITSSLGGDSKVVLLRTCTIMLDPKDDSSTQQFYAAVNGPAMEGVDVVFLIVSTKACSDEMGSSNGFRAGLEVAHTIRPLLLKTANALALQIRRGAASQDGLAALFENVVGTVREGSAVILTCSDQGLSGAVGSIRGSLSHLKSILTQ